MSRKGTPKYDFVEWLRSKKPDEVVGYTHGAPTPGSLHDPMEPTFTSLCPLGSYCAERGTDLRYGPNMELIRWAFGFMETVDEESPDDDPQPMTARRALQLLGEDV